MLLLHFAEPALPCIQNTTFPHGTTHHFILRPTASKIGRLQLKLGLHANPHPARVTAWLVHFHTSPVVKFNFNFNVNDVDVETSGAFEQRIGCQSACSGADECST